MTKWDFPDPPNTYIFTVETILNKKEPIAYVHHDNNGDWQFLPNRAVSTKEAKIASLAAMTVLDPSINELSNLRFGYEAFKNKGKWKISKKK